MVALLATVAACNQTARPGRDDNGPQLDTRVRVENQAFLDMNVYVLTDGGGRQRLGTVTGNTSQEFVIPAYIVGPANSPAARVAVRPAWELCRFPKRQRTSTFRSRHAPNLAGSPARARPASRRPSSRRPSRARSAAPPTQHPARQNTCPTRGRVLARPVASNLAQPAPCSDARTRQDTTGRRVRH